ncbi:hypothetical protein GCM10028774_54620 [Spirosoma jeollabukense]
MSASVLAQHTIGFTNGHTGKASAVLFKAKTVLIKSFDTIQAPLQEVPKTSIEQITMADGTVLSSAAIALRQSPADQVALFVSQEANRVANDDGSPRPIPYEWSNFLHKSITLVSVRHDQKNTVLTFVRRNTGLSTFIISSATYLYDRQDVRQAFRIINAGKFDLDVPITMPTGVDSMQIALYFERVTPGLEEVNFKSMPVAAGALGGPVGGYLIIGLSMNNPAVADGREESSALVKPFGSTKLNCVTCGGVGTVRCPNCAGEGTVTSTTHIPVVHHNATDYRLTSQRILCPVC